jgi:hypothetical protein
MSAESPDESVGTGRAVSLREELLDSALVGAALYSDAIEGVNRRRPDPKDHIPVLEPEAYRERAEDWLTEDREESSSQLPATDDWPLLVVPRLTQPITVEENVTAWREAAPRGLYSAPGGSSSDLFHGRFLSRWTDDELSGFDPELKDETPFEVLPTGYDIDREGTVTQQVNTLRDLQDYYTEIGHASLWSGVVLARRFAGRPIDLRETFVRATTFEPSNPDRDFCVVYAYVDPDDKDAVFYDSYTPPRYAARLRVE